MGEQTGAVIHYDALGGPCGLLSLPDGIPQGWCVTYVAGQGWELRKFHPSEVPPLPLCPCGNDRHGYTGKGNLCRYCAGEAE